MGKKTHTNAVLGNMKHCYENLNYPWDLSAIRRTEGTGKLRASS